MLDSGDLAGTLELIGPSFRETIRIGHDPLKDGVLLGRYARCDGAGGLADDATLSRVHALLIQIDDSMLVVDTASSNGTWEHGERPRSRVFMLDGNTGSSSARPRARWRWAAEAALAPHLPIADFRSFRIAAAPRSRSVRRVRFRLDWRRRPRCDGDRQHRGGATRRVS
jgi:hypothetical protein